MGGSTGGPTRNDFASVFFAHKGKLIDKWEQYIQAYEIELSGILSSNNPITLLEIGVQNGGSLEFWANLLPPGSTVIGLDIDDRIGELAFDNRSIHVHVLDATDAAAVAAKLGDATFDIAIDDGSHKCADVLASLRIFFPRLRSGGLMFIEDLHASYSPPHGGSLRGQDTSIEYLKHVIDLLHADHLTAEQAQTLDELLPPLMRETLGSITFYDSLAVLRKMVGRKDRPWRRLISGESAQIIPLAGWTKDHPRSVLEHILFGEVAARSLEKEFLNINEENLQNSLLAKASKMTIETMKARLVQMEADMVTLESEVVARLRSLRQIINES